MGTLVSTSQTAVVGAEHQCQELCHQHRKWKQRLRCYYTAIHSDLRLQRSVNLSRYVRRPSFDVPRPTRICRALYLCMENKTEEKKLKIPKIRPLFFCNFPNFRNSWKMRKKNSSESVRAKFILRKTRGFIFWISSEFVRIRPILGK